MKLKTRVAGDRTLYTFSYLRNISYHAYIDAFSKKRGRSLNCTVSMLFSAFCLEAYLNHVGNQKIQFWDQVERNSPKEKAIILSECLAFQINWATRPWKTFKDAFSFRNKLVHGRTHYLKYGEVQMLAEGDEPVSPQTDWEAKINIEEAKIFLDDTKEIADFIDKKIGGMGSPLYLVEEGGYCS